PSGGTFRLLPRVLFSINLGSEHNGQLTLPVLFEHAEDTEIDIAVVEPFGFAEDGFFQEFEFAGDGTAAVVPGGAADFDAVEGEIAEAGGDHGAAGGGRDALAFVPFIDPVADAGIAVKAVDPVQADAAADGAAMTDDCRES